VRLDLRRAAIHEKFDAVDEAAVIRGRGSCFCS